MDTIHSNCLPTRKTNDQVAKNSKRTWVLVAGTLTMLLLSGCSGQTRANSVPGIRELVSSGNSDRSAETKCADFLPSTGIAHDGFTVIASKPSSLGDARSLR